jgi:Domain of unknown function (DUF4129)
MAGGRSGGLALLLALIAMMSMPPASAQDRSLEAIDSCIRKLDPDIDIGYERIAARCPDLVRRLQGSGWSTLLPPDWRQPGNDLSAGGLRGLRELLTHPPTQRIRAPDVTSLPGVLAALGRANPDRHGWWARTKLWLRGIFERPEPAQDEGWLTRVIGQNGLSQTVLELTSCAALALVVLLALAIVANELRVSGVLDGLRGRLARGRPAPAASPRHDAPSWDAVPPRQRPRLLLELVVARLTEENRLPPSRGLTARELTRAARLADERDRERLAELARLSECVRFSKAEVPSDTLAAAIEAGRELLERLAPGRGESRAARQP